MGLGDYWNQWTKDFFVSKKFRFKATGYDKQYEKDRKNRKKWAEDEHGKDKTDSV